jgi:hypothetical protein
MKCCPVVCVLPDSDKFIEDLRAISLIIYEFCENYYNGNRTLRKSVNEILSYFPHLSSSCNKIHYRSLIHEFLNEGGARSVIGICWTSRLSNGTPFPWFFEAVNNQLLSLGFPSNRNILFLPYRQQCGFPVFEEGARFFFFARKCSSVLGHPLSI